MAPDNGGGGDLRLAYVWLLSPAKSETTAWNAMQFFGSSQNKDGLL